MRSRMEGCSRVVRAEAANTAGARGTVLEREISWLFKRDNLHSDPRQDVVAEGIEVCVVLESGRVGGSETQ
jgi:hypothetical protein